MSTLASILRKYTASSAEYLSAQRVLSLYGLNPRHHYRPTACEVCGNALNLLPKTSPTIAYCISMGGGETLVVQLHIMNLGGGWHHDEITIQRNNPLCAGEVTSFSRGSGYTKCTCKW